MGEGERLMRGRRPEAERGWRRPDNPEVLTIAVTDTTALAINRLIAAADRRIRDPASSVGR